MTTPSFYRTETTAYDYLQARAPRELWAAVLKQAIEDAVNGPPQAETEAAAANLFCTPEDYVEAVKHDARHWMADEENEPRRFLWVCDVLGLDPQYVRGQVKERICNP